MVLGPKSEDRIKDLLKEYHQERRENLDREISDATAGIFLWGFLAGIVAAYTSLWPFIIGATVGFSLARRELAVVNNAFQVGNELVSMGYQRLREYINPT